ncbi:MAG: trypsin family protein [Hyphomicrobiales bacterium]|nr:trypsin family protein [Hyphomicrobiales bacterium]
MAKHMIFGAALLLGFATAAQALVGPSHDEAAAAAHTLMLLKRDARGSSFCTASVIARDVLLTAGHCVTAPENLRAYWPGGDLEQKALAIAVHPLYRADATEKRVRSIDLALVRLANPLPASFRPIPIAWDVTPAVGARLQIAGYGLTREGDARSGGQLHGGALVVREPLSQILVWAKDPANKGLGACTGDSGGPMLTQDGGALVAVTVWSQGSGAKRCGDLTQAARLAPQRAFIEDTLRGWGVR